MNIGQRIKERRKELGLSVDDIANKLGKNRATVYRYESNDIENLSITILEPLAQVLNTTPLYLLGYENAEELNTLSSNETKLLESYNQLNDLGKNEAVKRVIELTEIPKYTFINELSATKALEDMSNTLAAHDDDLTTKEKIEMDKRILNKINKLK